MPVRFNANAFHVDYSDIQKSAALWDGGYTIVRKRQSDRDVHIVMDHAPLGYLSIAAHGHADAKLAGALRHRIRHHAVYPQARQPQGHGGKQSNQQRQEPRPRLRLRHHLVHRPYSGHR